MRGSRGYRPYPAADERLLGLEEGTSGTPSTRGRHTTTAPWVWAWSEAAGSPMVTHVCLDDYRVVKSVIEGGDRTTRNRLVAYSLFIDPELGRVGLSDQRGRAGGTSGIGAIRGRDVTSSLWSAYPRQALGGMTQGIRRALLEHPVYDPRYGGIMGNDRADDVVPVTAAIAPLAVFFVNQADPPSNALCSRGLGAMGITGVAPAIAHALDHATSKRSRDLRSTLDELLSPEAKKAIVHRLFE